jgi:hypothetical protein
MEAVRTSETLVNLYQSTRRCNTEGSHRLNTVRSFHISTYLSVIYIICTKGVCKLCIINDGEVQDVNAVKKVQ